MIIYKRFFQNHSGSSDSKVVSLTKKEYGSAVHFLKIFIKSLKSMSDECLIAICGSSRLFGVFIIKYCADLD